MTTAATSTDTGEQKGSLMFDHAQTSEAQLFWKPIEVDSATGLVIFLTYQESPVTSEKFSLS